MAKSQEIAALAVSLSLENQNFSKQMSTINKQIKNLDKDFKSASQGVEGFENSTDGLNKKMEVTGQKIKLLNTKLAQQKKEYQSLEGTLTKQRTKLNEIEQTLGRGSKEWKQQAELVQRNAEKLGKLGTDLNSTKGDLARFNKELESTKSAAARGEKGIDNMKRKMGELKNASKEAGKSIARGLGAGGAGVAVAAGGLVTGMQEYNRDLARLSTNAAIAGNDMGLVEDAFKQVTTITGETDSAVESVSNLLATGFKDNQLEEVINNVNGAAIKFSDTLKTEGIADGIQETFATGEAVGMFGELLERSGVDLDKFNKGLADAQKKGEGANYILQAMKDQGLAGVTEKYKEMNPEVQANAEAQVELQSSLANLALILSPLVTKITDVVTKMAEWASENPTLVTAIVTISGVIAALVAIFAALSPIFTVISALAGVFGVAIGAIAAPVLIAIAAITAIIAVGVLLYKNWDYVKEKAKQLGAFLAVVWNGIKAALSAAWEGIKSTTATVWNWITGFFKKWGTTILVVISGPIAWIAALIYKNWDAIKAATSKAFNAIKTGITKAWAAIKATTSATWNFIKSITSSVWNGIKSVISGVWNGIKSVISSAISNVKSKVSSGFNAVKSSIANIWNAVKTKITSVWDGIVSKITGAVSTIKDGIKSGFSAMQDLITKPFTAAKKKVEEVLSGISNKAGSVKNFLGGLFGEGSVGVTTDNPSGSVMGTNVQGTLSEGASVMSALTGSLSALDYSSDKYNSSGNSLASGLKSKIDTAVLMSGMNAQNKNLETQNQLLMQMVNMLAAGQNIAVNVDGREVAKATSSYMDTELRKTRDSKSRARGGR